MESNQTIGQAQDNNAQKGRRPDYSADGVAVWVNQTSAGKPYLSIKMVGHNTVAAFKNEEQTENGTGTTTSPQ